MFVDQTAACLASRETVKPVREGTAWWRQALSEPNTGSLVGDDARNGRLDVAKYSVAPSIAVSANETSNVVLCQAGRLGGRLIRMMVYQPRWRFACAERPRLG